MLNSHRSKCALAGFVAAYVLILSSSVTAAEAGAEDPIPVPPGPATAEEPAAPQPAPAPAPGPTIIYAMPPGTPVPQQPQDTDPLVGLRRKPKKLRYEEGLDPPAGYVEVEMRRRGLIIAGSATFGGAYLFCVVISAADPALAIPIAGPMIAGYSYESNGYSSSRDEELETSMRIYGALGTIVQTAGVVMFIMGMSWKKMVWLRQDIAGLSIQYAPTVVGTNGSGLGIWGTF